MNEVRRNSCGDGFDQTMDELVEEAESDEDKNQFRSILDQIKASTLEQFLWLFKQADRTRFIQWCTLRQVRLNEREQCDNYDDLVRIARTATDEVAAKFRNLLKEMDSLRAHILDEISRAQYRTTQSRILEHVLEETQRPQEKTEESVQKFEADEMPAKIMQSYISESLLNDWLDQ